MNSAQRNLKCDNLSSNNLLKDSLSSNNFFSDKKLISAPMATLTHAAFRFIVETFGAVDEYYSEMINAGTFLTNGPFEKYYVIEEPAPCKMVWQITGHKTEHILQAAEKISELQGIGIDINMGCSAPEIVKSGAGAAWLSKDIENVRTLVSGVKAIVKNAATPKRLSVKMRLGLNDFSESQFFSFTDMLVKEGVTQITLHGRTAKDSYRVLPRWDIVEALALRYKNEDVNVILNGDVKDVSSLENALKIAPHVKGVMIARSSVERPWIFKQLKNHLENKTSQFDEKSPYEKTSFIVDREKLALDFVTLLQKYQPVEFFKTRMQRFFSYYCSGFSFAHYFRTKMLNAKTPEEACFEIADYFKRQESDRMIEVC